MPRLVLALFFLFFSSFASARLDINGNHQLTRYEQEDLEQMINDMIAWVVRESRENTQHYRPPPELPSLVFVSPEVMAEGGCRTYCPVAQFLSDGRLTLSTKINVFQDPLEESVLLHELIHYLQWYAGKWIYKGGRTECEEERDRESEAYRFQKEYYASHGGYLMPFTIGELFCGENGELMVRPPEAL